MCIFTAEYEKQSRLFRYEKCADTVAVDELVDVLRVTAVHNNRGNSRLGCYFCRMDFCNHSAGTSVSTRAAAECLDFVGNLLNNGDEPCVGVFRRVIVEKSVYIGKNYKLIRTDKPCNYR